MPRYTSQELAWEQGCNGIDVEALGWHDRPAPCVSVAEILKASTLVGAAGFVAAERVRNSRAGNQQRRVTLIGSSM
eukprot:3955240-Amphidinium_carterae.3